MSLLLLSHLIFTSPSCCPIRCWIFILLLLLYLLDIFSIWFGDWTFSFAPFWSSFFPVVLPFGFWFVGYFGFIDRTLSFRPVRPRLLPILRLCLGGFICILLSQRSSRPFGLRLCLRLSLRFCFGMFFRFSNKRTNRLVFPGRASPFWILGTGRDRI